MRVTLSYVTVAVIRLLPGSRSSKVDVPIVDVSIASLNVAVTAVVIAIPVAPLAGDIAVTVGGVVSVTVVNDHVELAASALDARSLTRGSVAPPFTVAV